MFLLSRTSTLNTQVEFTKFPQPTTTPALFLLYRQIQALRAREDRMAKYFLPDKKKNQEVCQRDPLKLLYVSFVLGSGTGHVSDGLCG